MSTAPDHDARFVRLDWRGPFLAGPDGALAPSPPSTQASDLEEALGGRGVYLVLGDHPVHGSRALLYIGRSDDLEGRLRTHAGWIGQQWRAEVYLADVCDEDLLKDVERLLIYAHSPCYNAQDVASRPTFSREIRLWNCGSFFRLLPEVSSLHPWYDGS